MEGFHLGVAVGGLGNGEWSVLPLAGVLMTTSSRGVCSCLGPPLSLSGASPQFVRYCAMLGCEVKPEVLYAF